MPKAYVYKCQEIGLDNWPPGELRLTWDKTRNPGEADVFVVPGALHMFKNPEDLDRFPYMKGNESKHVFFHCSDDEVKYGKPCRFIRCNTRPWNIDTDPNTIPWPWPVDDFQEYIAVPQGGFKYDVSFHGWMSSNTRRASIESFDASPLKKDIAAYPDFCGYIYETDEGKRRRREFRRSMQESRLALCPESIPGVFPYRYWEAMSAGRVAILVGSDFCFPWKDEIPYDAFTVFVSRADAAKTADIAKCFLAGVTDAELSHRGRIARQMWERYIDHRKWVELMTEAVEKAIA